MIEDKDTLYNIEDEDVDYRLEDEEAECVEESVPTAKRKPLPFVLMLKTLIGPVEGWKALKRARFTTERFASGCFYPLLALAALSESVMFIYEANMTATDFVKAALTTFVAFFFGYFSVLFVGGMLLPRGSRDALKTEIGKQMVMLSMSTFVLFWIFYTILPAFDSALFFLPIWTIYLIFKGVRLLRVPKDDEPKVIGLLCLLIIGLPLFWNWVMSEHLLRAAGI